MANRKFKYKTVDESYVKSEIEHDTMCGYDYDYDDEFSEYEEWYIDRYVTFDYLPDDKNPPPIEYKRRNYRYPNISSQNKLVDMESIYPIEVRRSRRIDELLKD